MSRGVEAKVANAGTARVWAALLLHVSLLWTACGSEVTQAATCVPGETRACLCTASQAGWQSCDETGAALTACTCEAVGVDDASAADTEAASDTVEPELDAGDSTPEEPSPSEDLPARVADVDLEDSADTPDVEARLPCSERTANEKQCKDCCDCEADLDCATRVACRDTCVTFDADHWAPLADSPVVTAPSELGPGGDYGVCLAEESESACKSCCECGDTFLCGDFRHCRDACVKHFGAPTTSGLGGDTRATRSVAESSWPPHGGHADSVFEGRLDSGSNTSCSRNVAGPTHGATSLLVAVDARRADS